MPIQSISFNFPINHVTITVFEGPVIYLMLYHWHTRPLHPNVNTRQHYGHLGKYDGMLSLISTCIFMSFCFHGRIDDVSSPLRLYFSSCLTTTESADKFGNELWIVLETLQKHIIWMLTCSVQLNECFIM